MNYKQYCRKNTEKPVQYSHILPLLNSDILYHAFKYPPHFLSNLEIATTVV